MILRRTLLCGFVLALSGALVQARAGVSQEFHQTYPLTAEGKVAVQNVNGGVHVAAWDRNEVKVDAVKRGDSQQELDDARIVVDAASSSITIRTKYPDHYENRHAATVDYTITVPRRAIMDQISSVNGNVVIDGIAGAIHARSVNGRVDVRRAAGDLDASTVNGEIDASFERLAASHVSLKTVNGGISIGLPKDSGAHLKANTVHGEIASNFGVAAQHMGFGPGSLLETSIGDGKAEIQLATVNGGIRLTRP